MSMKLLTSFLISLVIAILSTIALWWDEGYRFGFLLILSLPGLIVAFPVAMMGIAGNVHDPSAAVTGGVDVVFYTWLFYWFIARRKARAE
jgi:hypothetical protein